MFKKNTANKLMIAWWCVNLLVYLLCLFDILQNFRLISISLCLLSVFGILILIPVTSVWADKKWCVLLISKVFKHLMPIELIDYKARSVYTFAHTGNDGKLRAPTYWTSNIGDNILLTNGTIDPKSLSSYNYFWLPLSKADRVAMVLSSNFPDFDMVRTLDDTKKHEFMYEAWNFYVKDTNDNK